MNNRMNALAPLGAALALLAVSATESKAALVLPKAHIVFSQNMNYSSGALGLSIYDNYVSEDLLIPAGQFADHGSGTEYDGSTYTGITTGRGGSTVTGSLAESTASVNSGGDNPLQHYVTVGSMTEYSYSFAYEGADANLDISVAGFGLANGFSDALSGANANMMLSVFNSSGTLLSRAEFSYYCTNGTVCRNPLTGSNENYMPFDLRSRIATNTIYTVVVRATAGVGTFKGGTAYMNAYTDPYISIVGDGSDYTLALSAGVNNVVGVLPGSGAVPEPDIWALSILGFGLTGGALRRRRTLGA